MAVLTFHMITHPAGCKILRSVVHTGKILHRVYKRFGQLGLNICGGYIAVMADQAIILFKDVL